MSDGIADQVRAHIKTAEDYAQKLPRITVDGNGRKVLFRTPSRVATLRVVSLYSKEPETVAWIAAMDAATVLYDVGANMGLYTIWAAATQDATVYAFEPEAASYATLCGNIFDNNLGQRVKAYCLGISDMPGLGEIMLSSLETATSGHQVNLARATPSAPHTARFPQGVVTRTLDALVYEDGLPCPSHIKIDVDGLEHAIIDGASRLLADPRLRSVLIELDLKSQLHLDTMTVIEAAGFRRDEATYEKLLQKTTGGNALIGNIIFSR